MPSTLTEHWARMVKPLQNTETVSELEHIPPIQHIQIHTPGTSSITAVHKL